MKYDIKKALFFVVLVAGTELFAPLKTVRVKSLIFSDCTHNYAAYSEYGLWSWMAIFDTRQKKLNTAKQVPLITVHKYDSGGQKLLTVDIEKCDGFPGGYTGVADALSEYRFENLYS